MNSLYFFLMAHLIMAVLSGVVEGGGGVVTTTLRTDISATSTSIEVISTEGFLKKDYIVIGDEYIKYGDYDADTFNAGTGFLGMASGRGYNGTEASVHAAGTKVLSSNADPLNAALGFNILSTGETVGEVNIINAGNTFLSTTLVRFVTWDYGILQVGVMAYVRTALQLLGGAFLIYLGLQLVGAFGRRT